MTYLYESYLAHHGVKGQKWGVRRYQNDDGTLTAEGKARYDSLSDREKKNYNTFNEMAKGLDQVNERLYSKYAKTKSPRLLRSITTNSKDAEGLRREAEKILDKSKTTTVQSMRLKGKKYPLRITNPEEYKKQEEARRKKESEYWSKRADAHRSGKPYDKNGASYYKQDGTPVAVIGFEDKVDKKRKKA